MAHQLVLSLVRNQVVSDDVSILGPRVKHSILLIEKDARDSRPVELEPVQFCHCKLVLIVFIRGCIIEIKIDDEDGAWRIANGEHLARGP